MRRSIHRAVADLLAHHYGKARRNAVMVDVAKPSADDTREVRVTAEEIQRVLAVCDEEFRNFAALAMLLAVDRDPLLRIAPRHFHEELGTLEIIDTKTASRPRTLILPSPAWSILRRRSGGRETDDRLFDWTPHQVRHHWDAVRDLAAGNQTRNKRERNAAPDPVRARAERLLQERGVVTLPVLRFKDLRHLLPTAWNALGLPAGDLPEIMGWAKGSNMAERYTTARIVGERDNMDRAVAFLGLDRLHLQALGGIR